MLLYKNGAYFIRIQQTIHQTLKFLVAIRRRSAGILSLIFTSTMSPTTSSSAWMLHFSPFRITVANYHNHCNMQFIHQCNFVVNQSFTKIHKNSSRDEIANVNFFTTVISIVLNLATTTTTVLWPFFRDHPGEPVPEENFWTLWC